MTGNTTLLTTDLICVFAEFQVFWIAPATSPDAANAVTERALTSITTVTTARMILALLVLRKFIFFSSV